MGHNMSQPGGDPLVCHCYNAEDYNCTGVAQIANNSFQELRPYDMATATILMLITVLGFIVNVWLIVVLSLMLKRKRAPWKSHGVLISLCVGHLPVLGLLFYQACRMVKDIIEKKVFGIWNEDNHARASSLLQLAFFSPFINYAALCMLQLYALRRPLQYQQMSLKKYLFIIFWIWVVTFLIGGLSQGLYILTTFWKQCYEKTGRTCTGLHTLLYTPYLSYQIGVHVLFSIIVTICFLAVRYKVSSRKLKHLFSKNKIHYGGSKSSPKKSHSLEDRFFSTIRTFVIVLGLNIAIYVGAVLLGLVVRIQWFHQAVIIGTTLYDNVGSGNGTNGTFTCAQFYEKEQIYADSNRRLASAMLLDTISYLRMVIEPIFHMTFNPLIRSFVFKVFTKKDDPNRITTSALMEMNKY